MYTKKGVAITHSLHAVKSATSNLLLSSACRLLQLAATAMSSDSAASKITFKDRLSRTLGRPKKSRDHSYTDIADKGEPV